MPLYFEDFVVGRTDEFGDYAVTREEIVAFAEQYDPQPFHLDDKAAEKSLFGKLCASGWHTCAMMMRMLVDRMDEQRSASLGSPGVEALRWLKPVFPGDRLRVRMTVEAAVPSKSRPAVGVVTTRNEVLNQQDEPVMTMQSTIFFARRPATGQAGGVAL